MMQSALLCASMFWVSDFIAMSSFMTAGGGGVGGWLRGGRLRMVLAEILRSVLA